ncbi:hypothetical protein MOQ_008270 [Trypanosoma cruzi marinkellei]|uniref:Serine/threonine-protein phosphatase n=1 Tax=Trypanosoma cruzi marinkellei TaxID=85056 RepID=K2MQQ7_TRYCR|nr:hypothetical protein MOQ_008270 [Trypanosoma cruzi marinkellei]
MGFFFGDSHESYLVRYRLRLLMEKWLDVLAKRRPEDPFACLVELINAYTQNGVGLVTCENKWCEMVIPVSEYAAHLSNCSEEGKWVKCTRCNLRVEASRMRQHKMNCKLESCTFCGEMVVPCLRDMCPYKLKADAERAFSKQLCDPNKPDNVVSAKENTKPPLPSSIAPSSAGAPSYLRQSLSFPDNLRDRLICIQDLWRKAFFRERFQALSFKFAWRAVELYREKQATKVQIAVHCDNPKATSSHRLMNYAAPMIGCISTSRFEALAKTITSGEVVEFATAKRIISMAIGILTARPLVQRVTIPEDGAAVVIGDLHGQMKDLCEAIRLTGGLPNPRRYVVFNGDFVDRGSNGMGVILYIFALLCAFPAFVFINRGNHEDTRVNAEYGFETEVYGKYGMEDAKRLLELIVDSYEAMPLMTLLDGMILVVHGGVPRVPVTLERIESLGRMRHIPTPAGDITEDEQIVMDILWNDPVEKLHSRQLGLRHRGEHWRTSKRGCGVEYLAPITEEFLRQNNLRLVVRSHEEVQAGFELIHNGKCCTVFSASNYCGVAGNRGAIAVFSKGSLHPVFHTWYVQNDELDTDVYTAKEFLHDIMPSVGNNSDIIEKEVKSKDGRPPEELDEKQTNATSDKKKECEGAKTTRIGLEDGKDDMETDNPAVYDTSVGRSVNSRVNVLMILAGIIFRKRYAILSGFVAADYNQSGIIYKIEWCEVMRSVLEIDLPWYYLCRFFAAQEELDGVPCVRYMSFLRRFDALFSSQYLLPFQVACVRRVFGDMDLPEDLLSRLDKTDFFEATTASSPLHGQRHTVASAYNRSDVRSFAPSRPTSMSRSLISSKSPESHANQSQGSSFPVEAWRSLKIDFNLLVSILRSESRVAANLEDDAMYALFQYLDQEECGHVVLGNLVDLVEATLVDEEAGAVLLETSMSLDTEVTFSFGDNWRDDLPKGREAAIPPIMSQVTTSLEEGNDKRQTDAGMEMTTPRNTTENFVVKGQEKESDETLHGKPSLVTLVAAGTPENMGTHEKNLGLGLSHAAIRPFMNSVDESIKEALWLYPALLRLHEGFDYGSLSALRKNFRNLNRTGDGKLTFDQLNVAIQLMGRHMREPFTPEQSKIIFSAIRLGGRRLTMARPLDAFASTQSDMHFSMSFPSCMLFRSLKDTTTDLDDGAELSHITINEFVTFFSITSTGGNLNRRRSHVDSLKTSRVGETYDPLSISGSKHHAELENFLEDLRSWPQLELLGELTVKSFSSRFDGNTTLLRALQELLHSSSKSTRLMTGLSVSRKFSPLHFTKGGNGFVCPPASSQPKLSLLTDVLLAQESMPERTQPNSGIMTVVPNEKGETHIPVNNNSLNAIIPIRVYTDRTTAAHTAAFTPASGSAVATRPERRQRPDKIQPKPNHISTAPGDFVPTSSIHDDAQTGGALAGHSVPLKVLFASSHSSLEGGMLQATSTITPSQVRLPTPSGRRVSFSNMPQPRLPTVRAPLTMMTPTPPSARIEDPNDSLKRN